MGQSIKVLKYEKRLLSNKVMRTMFLLLHVLILSAEVGCDIKEKKTVNNIHKFQKVPSKKENSNFMKLKKGAASSHYLLRITKQNYKFPSLTLLYN